MAISHLRRIRARHAELVLAVIYLISGVGFFLDPSQIVRSPAGRTVGPFDSIWSGLWIAGGLLITVGIVRHRPRLLQYGWALTGTGLIVAAVAILELRGVHEIRLLSYVAVSTVAIARVVRYPDHA